MKPYFIPGENYAELKFHNYKNIRTVTQDISQIIERITGWIV